MEQPRIRALDGLRAFAIIFVLFAHSSWTFSDPIIIKIGAAEFQNFFYNGWSGVDLFFVLSGFLIASQLLKSPLTYDNLKKFCAKRYFRIAPPYYMSVILALIFMHILPAISDGSSFLDLLSKWWQPVLSHLFFINDYVARSPSIDGLFWSIAVEMKFYLILPLLIYLLVKIKRDDHKICVIVIAYLLYLAARISWLYGLTGFLDIEYARYFIDIKTPFHLALDGLTIGVLCAFILNNQRVKLMLAKPILLNTMFFSALAMFITLGLSPHFLGGAATFFEYAVLTPLFSISFGFVLIALVGGCSAANFFSNFILRFIAKISYSMYLTHLYALYFQMKLIDMLSEVIGSMTLCWLISLPIFFAIAICLAYLLYICVEKPFITWSRNRWA